MKYKAIKSGLLHRKWLMVSCKDINENYPSVHSPVCVCACAGAALLHAKMHTMYACMMYAFRHLKGGMTSHVTAHVCSGNYWDVLSSFLQEVSLQLKTKLKMTPVYARSSSAHCLPHCSFQCVAMARWKV